jgi:hypothetical protein
MDYETQARGETVALGGRAIVLREIPLEGFRKLGDIVGQLTAFKDAGESLTSDDAEKVVDGLKDILTKAPGIIVRLIQVAAMPTILDQIPVIGPYLRSLLIARAVLKAPPREIIEALLAIIRMNNLMEMARKKAPEFPSLGGLAPSTGSSPGFAGGTDGQPKKSGS